VLGQRPPVVALVLHPRQWVRSPRANALADFERILAEGEYRLRLLARRSG
jgi:hypothetical protein